MHVDDLHAAGSEAWGLAVAEDVAEPRRAYVTATFPRRLHQVAFRERVLRAYAERCALCRLRHQELLDAAHITPDYVIEVRASVLPPHGRMTPLRLGVS
jgi:predicted restriction endonuclease